MAAAPPPAELEPCIRHHLAQHLPHLPPPAAGQVEVTMCYLDVQNAASAPQRFGAGTFVGPLDRSTPEALQRVLDAFRFAVPDLLGAVRAADMAHPATHVLVVYTVTVDGRLHRGALSALRAP